MTQNGEVLRTLTSAGWAPLRLAARLTTCLRGIAVAVAAAVGIPLVVLSVVSIALLPLSIGLLTLPPSLLGLRRLADLQRGWAREWFGVAVNTPYREIPADLDGGLMGRIRLCRALLSDPATWRDLLWALLNVPVGILLGVLPASMVVNGLEGILVSPFLWLLIPGHPLVWALSIPLGVVLLPLGLTAGPRILRGHALFSQWLLAPGPQAMTARINALAESRTEVVDASAAELRRIERDLHDGAQARLVAVGMNIGLAEQLIRADPELALSLLAEARESSGQALSELRGLVRGIHPPVLAERGLEGAVRALALTLPIPVNLDLALPATLAEPASAGVPLPGRPPAPVESAAYFAIAEALANTVKHSGATQVWVSLAYGHGRLSAVVRDDGVGGADAGSGGGLRGIGKRLAAFDGTITVTSPHGGPTVVTLELPCELSSPRTSPSFGTG